MFFFFWSLNLQIKTKLQKVLKRTLGFCKIQIVFKNQKKKISNVFRFKDRLPYDLVSCVVYKFQCGKGNASNYGATDRNLKVRSEEHINISPLPFKNFSRQPRVQYVITFCLVIVTPHLIISPFWLKGLISFC